MTDYVKFTNFTVKDSLPTGDTNKVIRGAEFDTEFDAIATAVGTKSNSASPTFTGTVTIPTADINGGNIDGTVIGVSTAAAGTFTDLTATGTVNLSGLSVTFSQLDAGAVTLSSETFSDVDNQIPTNAAVIDYVVGAIPGIAEVNDLTAVVTWADVPDANITESSVTQHEAALSITASQLSDVTATAAELNYVDGVTSNIQTQIDSINPSPIHTATASGTLANGDTVIVNSDGTVSAVGVTGNAQGAGTPVVFESARANDVSSVYDANAQKIVIAYQDAGNSDYGTAVVGTVSGTSISFGTPVVFESSRSDNMSVAYDSNAQKVVIAYQDIDNGNYGTAIVGTISGTSISFGTATVFSQALTSSISTAYAANAQRVVIAYRGSVNYGTSIVGTISGTSISFGTEIVFESANVRNTSIAYDANAQRIVIAYEDEGNSDYGTAVVGAVSSNSITFGSAVVFESAAVSYISAVYASDAQKVVIAYQDGGNSNYGTAIVGTISGISISFGTATVFQQSNRTNYISAAYDSNAQKVVISFQDDANSDYGTAVSGTVSGTSISFGSPTVFENSASYYLSAAYDANAEKVVISYWDFTGSGFGTAVVFTADSLITNLTAENYIGISDAAYSNGATATIQIIGSVDDAQSGLTAGQQYFVQEDGTLALTADTTSVVAGTAVSATEIIVKG